MIAFSPLSAWALMLLLGVLHHDVSPSVPPLGYWLCLALAVLASLIVAWMSPSQAGGGR